MANDRIQEQAAAVLRELVGSADEPEHPWNPERVAVRRALWSDREREILLAPARELVNLATLHECEDLLVSSVHRCREAAMLLAESSVETVHLPSGTPAPRELARLAERTAGGNLPHDEDTLIVEVVRQAFLSSGPPSTIGVPALSGYPQTLHQADDEPDGPYIPSQRQSSPLEAVPAEIPMTNVLITYDGRRPQRVHREIRKLKARWCRPTKRTWIVRTPLDVDGIHRVLQLKVGKRCKLLVVEVGSGASWQNMSPAVHTWISTQI